eukprot:c8531_g1_i1.p1 GENE.c8531_g1_i1~~c8531_g1_i1.p1  ORF type:complete len:295 (-),score=62.35 c8531_g1_i1:537-1397(-)
MAAPFETGVIFRIKAQQVFLGGEVSQRQEILIGGDLIARISPWRDHDPSGDLDRTVADDVCTLDWSNLLVVPGFIDSHCHITGGGGELGFRSRCPESKLHEFLDAGITTVVGVLGTDGITRSLENLLAKVRSLNEEGITAYMYTGNYHYPTKTITGSVARDITLINEVIGVGELAISDHRGSSVTRDELCRLLSECHVAGMLSGKAGVLHVHMGAGASRLQPLVDALEHCDVPMTRIVPTHCGRPVLVDEAMAWASRGGWVTPHRHRLVVRTQRKQIYFSTTPITG